MDSTLLEQAGLNVTQAKAYLALITAGNLTPPALAEKTHTTRTNAYEVLKQLSELGLAIKSDATGSKLTYRPSHPSVLEKLIEQRRDDIVAQQQRLRSFMPQLMSYFYTYSDQPGVRFFQEKAGLTKIYEDILRTRQPVYFIRSSAYSGYLGTDFYDKFLKQKARLGIKTIALTPAMDKVPRDTKRDEAHLIERIWIDKDKYTSPVEWDIYGDKVAVLSYGREAIGMIIESPQIAESMRQLFGLIELSANHSAEPT